MSGYRLSSSLNRAKNDLCEVNKISTRTAIIYIDGNNILHMEMKDRTVVDLEDAIDNALVIKNITKGQKILKLIDARSNFKIDKKARNYVSTLDKKQTLARAVIKASFIDALLNDFFSKLNTPEIPTKIFTEYDDAYRWLLGHSASRLKA